MRDNLEAERRMAAFCGLALLLVWGILFLFPD